MDSSFRLVHVCCRVGKGQSFSISRAHLHAITSRFRNALMLFVSDLLTGSVILVVYSRYMSGCIISGLSQLR